MIRVLTWIWYKYNIPSHFASFNSSHFIPSEGDHHGSMTYNNPDFLQALERAAAGRPIHTVDLYKPENSSLGFSVVGIKNDNIEGQLGIFVQGIQPGGIAAQWVEHVDGTLC